MRAPRSHLYQEPFSIPPSVSHSGKAGTADLALSLAGKRLPGTRSSPAPPAPSNQLLSLGPAPHPPTPSGPQFFRISPPLSRLSPYPGPCLAWNSHPYPYQAPPPYQPARSGSLRSGAAPAPPLPAGVPARLALRPPRVCEHGAASRAERTGYGLQLARHVRAHRTLPAAALGTEDGYRPDTAHRLGSAIR